MKIKTFASIHEVSDDVINDFIKDKKVIDIKLSTTFEGPKEHFEQMHYTVLVMYED